MQGSAALCSWNIAVNGITSQGAEAVAAMLKVGLNLTAQSSKNVIHSSYPSFGGVAAVRGKRSWALEIITHTHTINPK
jgi:hypothetical protein